MILDSAMINRAVPFLFRILQPIHSIHVVRSTTTHHVPFTYGTYPRPSIRPSLLIALGAPALLYGSSKYQEFSLDGYFHLKTIRSSVCDITRHAELVQSTIRNSFLIEFANSSNTPKVIEHSILCCCRCCRYKSQEYLLSPLYFHNFPQG